MEIKRFNALLSQFAQAKIAVLGDFFLDLYIIMDRALSEFSLETHKEAFQAVELRGQPGTAGVTTNNLQALGANAAAIGVTGRDGNGDTLRRALEETGVRTEYLVAREDRYTITYTKPLMREVDGSTVELNRIDIINRTPNPPDLNQQLAALLQEAIQEWDAILVVEQVDKDGFGALSPLLRKTLTDLSDVYKEKIIIADSRHFAAQYQKIAMKVNLSEAISAAKNLASEDFEPQQNDPLAAAQTCADICWSAFHKPIFITLGKDGICGMAEEGFFHHPGFQIDGPVDIVGAGDASLAGIGLALCCGASPEEAAYIGNLVGSITVQQIGTTGIATQADLRRRHAEYQQQLSSTTRTGK